MDDADQQLTTALQVALTEFVQIPVLQPSRVSGIDAWLRVEEGMRGVVQKVDSCDEARPS